MARVIVAAPPLWGHMTPLVALAGELRARGHAVRVVDYFARAFDLPDGLERAVVPCRGIEQAAQALGGGNLVLQSIQALQTFCLEVYSDTLRHCAEFKPDLLVFDQLLPLAPMIAQALGCPYLYSISSPLEFLHQRASCAPVKEGLAHAFNSLFAEMRADLAHKLRTDTRSDGGLPRRYLCFATEMFCGGSPAVQSLTTQAHGTTGGVPVSFVGPAFLRRTPSAQDTALAAQLSGFRGNKFYVSLGSVLANLDANRQSALKLFRNIVLSHNEPNSLFLFSAPEPLLREALLGVPIHAAVIVRPFVNQFHVIDQFSLVFGHGGYNTVAECLAKGIPMIAFPFVFDQTWIAQRLEELGVGARLSRVRHTSQMVRDRADRLLRTPDVQTRLAALQADAHRFDGRCHGADVIEALLSPACS